MSPTEQRIAIAEACGWKTSEYGHIRGAFALVCGDKTIRTQWCNSSRIPSLADLSHYLSDYLNDLNACHEMEKVLGAKADVYEFNLDAVSQHYSYRATAAQRAEAFLRTLNLWHPPSLPSLPAKEGK